MSDIKCTFDKNKKKIFIEIDASDTAVDEADKSKSGKTRLLATTQGFMPVEGAPKGWKLSLNMAIPPE